MANETVRRKTPLGIIKRALCFVRVVDPHDGLVSLSNIILMIIIVKVTLVKNPSLVDLGALLVSLANYTAKKVINQNSAQLPPPPTSSPLESPTHIRVVS